MQRRGWPLWQALIDSDSPTRVYASLIDATDLVPDFESWLATASRGAEDPNASDGDRSAALRQLEETKARIERIEGRASAALLEHFGLAAIEAGWPLLQTLAANALLDWSTVNEPVSAAGQEVEREARRKATQVLGTAGWKWRADGAHSVQPDSRHQSTTFFEHVVKALYDGWAGDYDGVDLRALRQRIALVLDPFFDAQRLGDAVGEPIDEAIRASP